MDEFTNKLIQDKCNNLAKELGEHCDSIRIFATLPTTENKDTPSYTTGYGNFYAQLGQVKEWITIQDQYSKKEADKKED